MNSHAPITYGAESFEDYMRQFMSSEVRYKDFRKTIVQKFDSSRQDSFIHWLVQVVLLNVFAMGAVVPSLRIC